MEREKEESSRKISKSAKSRDIVASDINIHLDLQVEILKKLPVKSLMRFHCVSKQWSFIIGCCRDFIDSIMARPLAQPPSDNLHFIFHHFSPKTFFFFSSTHTYKEPQTVSIPSQYQEVHFGYQYVRGLICCSTIVSPLIIIHNPTTRESISLPKMKTRYRRNCYFGYEQVMNQYKVMCFTNGYLPGLNQHKTMCFTLGDPMKQWRNIQGIGNHHPILKGVHINGTIYYTATFGQADDDIFVILNFRTEKFYHIKASIILKYWYSKLININGKLGCLCSTNGAVEMWVMEDAEKQTWSKTFVWLPHMFKSLNEIQTLSNMTLGGDIFTIKLMYRAEDSLYVNYYDMKQTSFRRIEIKDTTKRSKSIRIIGVSDHVENTISLQHLVNNTNVE